MEAKNRLKQILNHKTVYVDGLRPDEVSMLVKNLRSQMVVENDLTKQDR